MTIEEAWDAELCTICQNGKMGGGVVYAHVECWKASSYEQNKHIMDAIQKHVGGSDNMWAIVAARRDAALVSDAPKPAQVERLTPTSVRLPDYFKNHPARDVGPPAPLAGLEDAASRRFKELTAPLVMAMEEALAHLHTVSAYVRNEKQFSATHAAVTRRVAQVLREYKGGR